MRQKRQPYRQAKGRTKTGVLSHAHAIIDQRQEHSRLARISHHHSSLCFAPSPLNLVPMPFPCPCSGILQDPPLPCKPPGTPGKDGARATRRSSRASRRTFPPPDNWFICSRRTDKWTDRQTGKESSSTSTGVGKIGPVNNNFNRHRDKCIASPKNL